MMVIARAQCELEVLNCSSLSLSLQLVAVLDTAALSKEMKMYLPLFLEVLFESPMIREGGGTHTHTALLYACVLYSG